MKELIFNHPHPSDTRETGKVDKYFRDSPFPKPRQEQSHVIPIILKELQEGQKNIIVELPTGSGKSALSYFLPKLQDVDAYVLTHLKGLQEQYVRELPMMDNIMGKGNYKCKLNIPQGCMDEKVIQEAISSAQKGQSDSDTCSTDLAPCSTMENFNCPFNFSIGDLAKEETDFSDISTNFCGYYDSLYSAFYGQYFLTNASYLVSLWPLGILPQRDLLIVDEAHNLSSTLMNHFSMQINHKSLESLFNIPSWEEIKEAKGEVKARLLRRRNNILKAWNPKDGDDAGLGIPAVPSITPQTSQRIWQIGAKVFVGYLQNLSKTLHHNLKKKVYSGEKLREAKLFVEQLDKLGKKLGDWENWVWSKNDELNPSKITFKPLSIKSDAEKLIHSCAKQRVYMSATIGDVGVFCSELGLNPQETTFIKLNYSPFDIENRPIYTHLKGGNLTYKGKTEDDYFQTAKAIAEICWKYRGKKGLILPYTKAIQKDVIEALNKYHPVIGSRLKSHSDNQKERDEVFESFNRSSGNDVLISTYANQGYDGKDVDFCIIVKLPFGSIADIQVRKKMEMNPRWYRAKTATELTQMCGRVVRSQDDVGHTYIIDPSFTYHFEKGVGNIPLKTEMPKYVVESIERCR